MLPVLALVEGLSGSDAVLDLCAAPGSKTLQLVRARVPSCHQISTLFAALIRTHA
eukprot:COSAG01_NODE_12230_length_1777_cov_1.056615_2_plen_55_part_00